MMISFIVPLKTESPNKKEHWSKTYKRNKRQKLLINAYLNTFPQNISLPCQVTITRYGKRQLDTVDNLPMSNKTIRDTIANWLLPGLSPGRADSDSRIIWQDLQEKGEYAIKVEIVALKSNNN